MHFTRTCKQQRKEMNNLRLCQRAHTHTHTYTRAAHISATHKKHLNLSGFIITRNIAFGLYPINEATLKCWNKSNTLTLYSLHTSKRKQEKINNKKSKASAQVNKSSFRNLLLLKIAQFSSCFFFAVASLLLHYGINSRMQVFEIVNGTELTKKKNAFFSFLKLSVFVTLKVLFSFNCCLFYVCWLPHEVMNPVLFFRLACFFVVAYRLLSSVLWTHKT